MSFSRGEYCLRDMALKNIASEGYTQWPEAEVCMSEVVVCAFGEGAGAPCAEDSMIGATGGADGAEGVDAVIAGSCRGGKLGRARGMVDTSRSVLRREFVSFGRNDCGCGADPSWGWPTGLEPCWACAAFSHASLALWSTGQADTSAEAGARLTGGWSGGIGIGAVCDCDAFCF